MRVDELDVRELMEATPGAVRFAKERSLLAARHSGQFGGCRGGPTDECGGWLRAKLG